MRARSDAMRPPIYNVDQTKLWRDPYPYYSQMRRHYPVCEVPQLDAIVLSGRDDIFKCEKNITVFSSDQPAGLMTRLMGQNMMRKDGTAHTVERQAFFPAVSPRVVKSHWEQQFRELADRVLSELTAKGRMDLVYDYAARLSAEALKIVTGLTHVCYQDLNEWSQSMIDGIANYAGTKDAEVRCNEATSAIDKAIDERIESLQGTTDHSLISVMLRNDSTEESIRNNIKLAISGGQNETRDVIAGSVWAMLKYPKQLRAVLSGKAKWSQVFDEYCRFMSPIGMSPRRIARDHVYRGFKLEAGRRCFLLFGSANRDEDVFASPDEFDIFQDNSKSIAFGAGPHFCAGAWVARSLVSDVALPMIFQYLPHMRLSEPDQVSFEGWAFRGLRSLPVEWSIS